MQIEASRSAYRREGEETLIEIRLREVRQLFHTLDPSPFREKDLDDAAEQYLVEAFREAGAHRRLRLVVHLPAAEAASDAAQTLPDAVHNYFAYRERQLRADIKRMLRVGAISLAIGLVFLVACLGLRRLLVAAPLAIDRSIVDEGLLILGWVAMWRPTEALLYDWWPLARRCALLRRLSVTRVEVRAAV
ncbi:MAG TPA: hypothetical protein VN754_15420 [Candidatus Binataceae bacterium]|nr:hypothetical protein [Candidatus Binataceae bacterium]